MNNITVCHFGSYDPTYSRNAVVRKGLERSGITIIECNLRRAGWRKYLSLARQWWKIRNRCDAMLVAFPGQEAMFLARLLTRKPIIFDAFTSHYGGYILDRGYFSPRGLRAKYYRFLDAWSCRLADCVILDTQAHIDFFVREFNVPRSKFERVLVGADTDVFYPMPNQSHEILSVLFFGTYIPLQGAEHIVRAAKILEGENVSFTLIGNGQERKKIDALARELSLKNIVFIDKMSLSELNEHIGKADICLGIFGGTLKAGLVIPNKAYEAIACARPLISADTPAMRELFTDREDVLFCNSADPADLAAKIRELKNDAILRESLARRGHELFTERATPTKVAEPLIARLRQLL